MALRKIIPLLQNPDWSAEYIRVDELAYNRAERVCEIVVGFYANAECAMERPPITTRVIRKQGDEAELLNAALHDLTGPLVYSVVKAEDDLADAQDA